MFPDAIVDSEYLRSRLYCYVPSEDFFNSISDEKLENIKASSKRFLEEEKNNKRYLTNHILYYDCLRKLSKIDGVNMKNNEKIVFAINTLDPDLLVLKLWKSVVKTSKRSIDLATPEKKEELINQRKKELTEFYDKASDILGSRDHKILNYEYFYARELKKRLNNQEENNDNKKRTRK